MKKAIALLLLSLFAFNVQAEQEQEKAWSISLDAGVYDKYVWRGIQFNEEGVSQGAADFSYDFGDLGTFGINVWYNLDLDNELDDPTAADNFGAGNFSEIDYTFWWEKTYGDFTIGAGHIYYDFSQVDAGSTREFYVSVAYDILLAPSVTVYYDYEDVDGFYVDFAIGHSFDLGVFDMTLDVGANIGWADEDMAEAYYASTVSSGFTNYGLSAAVNIPVMDFTITPSVSYYSLLGDADDDTGFEDDDFVFGVNVNYSF